MESDLPSLHGALQDALDDLTSHRSSRETQNGALSALEYLLALACVDLVDSTSPFFTLQGSFECNIPSRLATWLVPSTVRLNSVANKETTDGEASVLSVQVTQALGLIQGVVLNHDASKRHMGRRYTLEIMVDLLLASRHLFPAVEDAAGPTSLTSMVLDTLLCILVDSSPAIRAFEQVNGVQVVVKILKRAGTPRETRMKCLEFLYFYLLDETTSPGVSNSEASAALAAAALDMSPRKPAFLAHPRDSSNSSSSSFASSVARSDSTNSSFTTATSLESSFSSMKAQAAQSDKNLPGGRVPKYQPMWPSASSTSRSLSPSLPSPAPPSPSPMRKREASSSSSSHPLLMLREVDFIPLSPKKPSSSEQGRVPQSPEHEDCGPLPALAVTRPTSDKSIDVGAGSPRKRAQLGVPSGVPRAATSAGRLASTAVRGPRASVGGTPSSRLVSSSGSRVASSSASRATPRVASAARLASTSSGRAPASSRLASSSRLSASTATKPVVALPEKLSRLNASTSRPPAPSSSPEKPRSSKLAPSTKKEGGDHSSSESWLSSTTSSDVPTTPTRRKSTAAAATPRASVHTPRAKSNPARLYLGADTPHTSSRSYSAASPSRRARGEGEDDDDERNVARTTEEKKILLGSMLGNVDALVDGVRKAGVWGLG